MISANRRCFGASGALASISAITIMPFMGVRISWLMVARKSDLAAFGAFCLVLGVLQL